MPDDILAELLEIARWTGSSRNTQPWHFIVVTDREQLRQIGEIRPPIRWVAKAPLAIAIVLDGANPTTEAYDEGRVTERLLIGARLLGLGGGTAWFGDEAQQQRGKAILGIPPDRAARSMVVLGYPRRAKTRGQERSRAAASRSMRSSATAGGASQGLIPVAADGSATVMPSPRGIRGRFTGPSLRSG